MATTTTTVTCATCKQPIDTTEGYLVTGEDGLQFTSAADPQLTHYEETIHFVCP